MGRNRQIATVSLALIAVGIVFLVASQVTYAATFMAHGRHASGIPYLPGAAIVAANFTFHVSEYDDAIDRWNSATSPRDYFLKSQPGGPGMTQALVYSGSGWDLNLAAYFTELTEEFVPSCKWWTDNYWNETGVYRAFMFGHTPGNGDKQQTVICLNSSPHGYPFPFEAVGEEVRITGLTHEMGHSLHLAHETGEGAMDVCWCRNIHQNEVNFVNLAYALPP